jgi:hypothetical protein
MQKNIRSLVDQQIEQYFSRLNHIDELFQKADQALGQTPQAGAVKEHLEKLRQERDNLASRLEAARAQPTVGHVGQEAEVMGPMAIWDIVAEDLEKLIERIGRAV